MYKYGIFKKYKYNFIFKNKNMVFILNNNILIYFNCCTTKKLLSEVILTHLTGCYSDNDNYYHQAIVVISK